MAETPVPITPGTGGASIAGDLANGRTYQQIKVVDATLGSENAWIINSDGTANIRVSGSVATTLTAVANQSVSGTVQTDVRGSVATVIIGGSIAASFTPPANQSVSGTVQTDVRGSVATVIIGGSIAASFTPPANQSVSGTIQADIRNSVAAVIIGGSIAATVTPAANQSIAGAVQIAGASPASIMTVTRLDNQVIGSMLGLVGQVTLHGITNVGSNQYQDIRVDTGTGAIVSSVVGLQGASVSGTVGSSIIGLAPVQWSNSSVITVSTGSVITVLQAPSIVGTYAEDSAHTSGDKGLLSLNVRNDTLASVTSADGDYGAIALGPVGEAITANAPITKWIRGTADLRGVQGASVTAIAAQGASVFTYITGIQVANLGSASVLVTLGGGLGSILGYTIAPAGGGSNILYPNALKTGENSAFTASISGAASVLVSAQGFIAKT